MTLTVTSIYAAVLGIIFIILRTAVIIERAKTGISILHKDNIVLAEKIRRFGNFVEVVPLALILLALSEVAGAPVIILHLIGGAFLLSRLLHPLGLQADNAKHPFRIFSGILTSMATVISVGSVVYFQFIL